MKLPDYILDIIEIYDKNNFEIYAVGGCIRDTLLHRDVNDYDLTTDATPDESMKILKDFDMFIIPTGLKHGTITVMYKHHPIEITTFRKDGNYVNHRQPEQVSFQATLEEDLQRRDFTINAIAYHPKKGLKYVKHALEDLNNKVIRAIGNPDQRFEEDALRMLRGIRFSNTLNFTIEENTLTSIKNNLLLLDYISKERIMSEFNKIIEYGNTGLLYFLKDIKLLEYLIPEFKLTYDYDQKSKWHNLNLFEHISKAFDLTKECDLSIRLAILFHDLGKPFTQTEDHEGHYHFPKHAVVSEEIAYKFFKKFKYDNNTINEVLTYIKFHDYHLLPNEKTLKKFLFKLNFNFKLAYNILKVQECDDLSKNPNMVKESLENNYNCLSMLKNMETSSVALTLKDLAINGFDMISLGYKGKDIGILLDQCLEHIYEFPNDNTKEKLIEYIKGSR